MRNSDIPNPFLRLYCISLSETYLLLADGTSGSPRPKVNLQQKVELCTMRVTGHLKAFQRSCLQKPGQRCVNLRRDHTDFEPV